MEATGRADGDGKGSSNGTELENALSTSMGQRHKQQRHEQQRQGVAAEREQIMQASQGPVARDIETRLRAALAPSRLEVIDDSESHRGHAGHDGSGESHFTVVVEAESFRGTSRVARQRASYAALGPLMESRVHALAIRATVPGEAA